MIPSHCVNSNNETCDNITVVIPAFNASLYLREAIDSALAQTKKPIEILVVDDGSTDDTFAIAESYGPPVKVLKQMNRGQGPARNRGIDAAIGEWIAFLDSDDMWQPTKLERQIASIGPNTIACHTNYRWFGLSDEIDDVSVVPPEIRYDVVHLAVHVPVLPSCLLVRRDLPLRFPDSREPNEDTLYVIELALLGEIRLVQEPLTLYRKRSGNFCSRPGFFLDCHQVMLRWLQSKADTLRSGASEEIREGYLNRIIAMAQRAKWLRHWNEFHQLRHYLLDYRNTGSVDIFLSETVYPRWVYWLKDMAKRVAGS